MEKTDLMKYKFFEYFFEIAKIPRGSGNTEAISNRLVDFAKDMELEYIQDKIGNVIIIKNPSKGYEDAEPVILQGHMDMVLAKTADCKKDLEKEGIDIVVKGDWLSADSTTLGADNGIAVAIMLSVLSENLPHPRLECIFTVDEETGLEGAKGIDISELLGGKYINIDSECEGVITVSCAGGLKSITEFDIKREKFAGENIEISLGGSLSRHSGCDIHKGRINAIKQMGRILYEISEKSNFRLVNIFGGQADNVIPNECTVEICSDDTVIVKDICREFEKIIQEEYRGSDPDFMIELKPVKSRSQAPMNSLTTDNIVAYLNCVIDGIERMSMDIEGLVQTSLNLGTVRCIREVDRDYVQVTHALRSSRSSEKRMLSIKLKNLAGALSGKYSEYGDYPAWEYSENSPLRELAAAVYREQTGKEAKIEAIHAGLESGYFIEKKPDLDCISIGPDMESVHTVNERLNITSAIRTYKLLIEILSRIR